MKTVGKFIIAGGVGFFVDFSLLNMMLWLEFGPITGRLISFSFAVMATFFINRKYTFNSIGNFFRQFQKYLLGSLLGVCINWIIYSLCLSYFLPSMSLIIASALAMIVNFIFYKFIVFKR
ncbi:GtrA family protein [Pseudochrobactrum lubricantis]|uniref:GtrA family protein n=1 Tax=Pseudochrobactrum lubricantis TaxID=558172 RepID=UPI0035DCF3A0